MEPPQKDALFAECVFAFVITRDLTIEQAEDVSYPPQPDESLTDRISCAQV